MSHLRKPPNQDFENLTLSFTISVIVQGKIAMLV